MNDTDSKTIARYRDHAASAAKEALRAKFKLKGHKLTDADLKSCWVAAQRFHNKIMGIEVDQECKPGSDAWWNLFNERLSVALGSEHFRLSATVKAALSRKDFLSWYLTNFSAGILLPENARRYVDDHLADLAKSHAKTRRTRWRRDRKGANAQMYESSTLDDADQEHAHDDVLGEMAASLLGASRAIERGEMPPEDAARRLLSPKNIEKGLRPTCAEPSAKRIENANSKRRVTRRRYPELARLEDFDQLDARELIEREEEIKTELRSNPAALCELQYHLHGTPRRKILAQYNPAGHIKVSEKNMRKATGAVLAACRRVLCS